MEDEMSKVLDREKIDICPACGEPVLIRFADLGLTEEGDEADVECEHCGAVITAVAHMQSYTPGEYIRAKVQDRIAYRMEREMRRQATCSRRERDEARNRMATQTGIIFSDHGVYLNLLHKRQTDE